MGLALEGGFDLGALALCFVAIALLVAAKELAQAIAAPLDFSIFGARPLHGVAVAIENHIVGALDDAIRGVEKAAAGFLSGLVDAFALLIAIPLLIIVGVRAALSYLWDEALIPRIRSITDTIKTTADAARARVIALEGTVVANLGAAERYAREHAASALSSATAYIDHRIDAAIGTLRGDIAAGVSQAEAYAELAVGKLRAAEDAAVAGAVGLAVEAKQAGLAAAAIAEAEAIRIGADALTAGLASDAAAIAQLDAAGKAALDVVRSVAVGVADDLGKIEGDIGALGTGALIASIPAIATLVHAIATEAGLENASCRSKVKEVCSTDPSAWTGLLEGLLAIGVGFSLAELAAVATPLIREVAPILAEAA